MFQICDFKNVGQGHGEGKRDLLLSTAIIDMHKGHKWHYCASSYRFRDVYI